MPRVLPFLFDTAATPWRKASALAWPAAWHLTQPAAVAGLLLVFALVWLGHLQSVALTAPMDNVEQWVWSHALAWGYHKHPPLPTWALWLAHQVAGPHALTAAVLGGLGALASIGVMYLLLRQVWSGFAAWLAVLAALCITFYSGRLNYYNHNILLMLCVSTTVYCWWQILQTGRTRWWVSLGVAAGLGMLSKYQYLLVLLPSAVCLLWLRPWASRRVAAQLGLALGTATLLFLPHALWLLTHTADDGPLAYALHTAKPTWPGAHGTLSAMQHSGIWLLDLVLNRCLPALLVLLAVKGLLHRTTSARPGNETLVGPTLERRVRPETFVLVWGLLPPLSITALGVLLDMDLQMQWGTAYALWLVPAAMVLLRLHRAQPPRWLPWATLGVFVLVQALLLAESWSTSAAGCCTNGKWRNFDSPALARELDASARTQVGGQFHVLVGPVNAMGAVAMALPDQPRVLIDARPDISPWISADELFGSGVVQLLPPGTALPGATKLPSGWSWRVFTPDDL